MHKQYFTRLQQSLVLLRVCVAFVFLAHAFVRLERAGSIQSFAAFLSSKGFVYGKAIVWAISFFEIAGGILLALGFFVNWLAYAFIAMLMAGIILIHAKLGWFVGEHGTGGCEYSFILIVNLVVLVAANSNEAGRRKLAG